MPELVPAVAEILERIKENPPSAFNEENTAVVLVEPLLGVLGWDTKDLRSVHRQYRVYDGTKLDYALNLEGKPAVFVEVKGLAQNLDDPKFVAQTVNYANNEGVLWCVLTNGVTYKVYKTNEPVAMPEKLMLEFSLKELEADDPSRNALLAALSTLSRASVAGGQLEVKADAVFLGSRVRGALEELLTKPSAKFRSLIESSLGESVDKDRLDRVLSLFAMVQQSHPVVAKASAGTTPVTPGKEGRYDRGHHVQAKPKAITELFDQLAERVTALGEISVTYTKFYVNFATAKQSFMTAQLFQDKLRVHFSIPWDAAPKPRPGAMRDVTKIGHYGMGATEFVLSSSDELSDVMVLASASFDRNRS